MNVIYFSQYIIFFFTLYIYIYYIFKSNGEFYFYSKLFITFFFLANLSGIGIILYLRNVGISFKSSISYDDIVFFFNLNNVLTIFYIINVIYIKNILYRKKVSIFPKIYNKKFINIIIFSLYFLSIFSLLIYAYKNGLGLLHQSSYEERYTNNLGLGIFTRLFPLYIPATILYILNSNKTIKIFLKAFIIVIVMGISIYIVMGGYRQLLLIGIAIVIFMLYTNKIITFKTIVYFGLFGLVLLNLLAFIRYGKDLNVLFEESDLLFQLTFISLFDSISPIDSSINIINAVNKYVNFQYLDPIINSFSIFIPRSIWASKPEFIMNAGNFYTIHILNYSQGVTISPTVVGELYLMGGFIALFIGIIIIAIILGLFDRMFYSSNILTQTFAYTGIFNTFFLYREGVSSILTRTFFLYCIFIFIYFISLFIYNILYRRIKVNENITY